MKKIAVLLSSIAVVFLFGSCSWTIPEKVTVKTNADYNLSAGVIKKDIKVDFNAKTIGEKVTIKNAKVYDYYPEKSNSKLQQFYLNMPIVEIPIDVSSYFNKSSITESIENLSFEKEIEVPEVALNFEETIDMAEIMKAVNLGMTVGGAAVSGNLNFVMSFDYVTYSEGSLVVSCNGMADYSTVSIVNGDGVRKNANFYKGNASISLNDFSFTKNGMRIEFSNPCADVFVGTITESSKIRKAAGLTVDQEIEIPIGFNVDSVAQDTAFEACTIGEGTLDSSIIIPDTWTNVSVAYEIATKGSVSLSSPKSSGVKKSIDLKDKTLSTGATRVDAKVYLLLANASFDGSSNPKFTSASDIKSLKEVRIHTTDIQTSVNKSEKLDETVLKTVKRIGLGSSGIKGTYTNTFPEGNDLELVASSGFLGIANKSTTLKSGVKAKEMSVMASSDPDYKRTVVIKETPVAADEYNSWDFTVNIHLPGYTPENPERIVVKNVVPKAKYTISLNVTPEINWKDITIDSSDLNESKEMDLGFNVTSLIENFGESLKIDNLGKKVNIKSLPIYIYCSKPELEALDGIGFNGTIKMFAKDANGPVKKPDGTLAEEIFCENKIISFVNEPKVTIEDKTVITDVSSCNSSINKDVGGLLQVVDNDDSLCIKYDISLANSSGKKEVTITPDMLDSSKTEGKIGISAIVIIPLNFLVTEDLDFDLLKLVNGEKTPDDLFGRKSATEKLGFEDYMDVVKSAVITYKSEYLPINANPDISLVVDLGYRGGKRTKSLKSGTIDIERSDLSEMLKTYPFYPNATCSLKQGTEFTIAREFRIQADVSVHIETDGSIVLPGEKK